MDGTVAATMLALVLGLPAFAPHAMSTVARPAPRKSAPPMMYQRGRPTTPLNGVGTSTRYLSSGLYENDVGGYRNGRGVSLDDGYRRDSYRREGSRRSGGWFDGYRSAPDIFQEALSGLFRHPARWFNSPAADLYSDVERTVTGEDNRGYDRGNRRSYARGYGRSYGRSSGGWGRSSGGRGGGRGGGWGGGLSEQWGARRSAVSTSSLGLSRGTSYDALARMEERGGFGRGYGYRSDDRRRRGERLWSSRRYEQRGFFGPRERSYYQGGSGAFARSGSAAGGDNSALSRGARYRRQMWIDQGGGGGW